MKQMQAELKTSIDEYLARAVAEAKVLLARGKEKIAGGSDSGNLSGGALCESWSQFLFAVFLLGFALFVAYLLKFKLQIFDQAEQMILAEQVDQIRAIGASVFGLSYSTVLLAPLLFSLFYVSREWAETIRRSGYSFTSIYGIAGMVALQGRISVSFALRTIISGICKLLSLQKRWAYQDAEKKAQVSKIMAQQLFGTLTGQQAFDMLVQKQGFAEAERIRLQEISQLQQIHREDEVRFAQELKMD